MRPSRGKVTSPIESVTRRAAAAGSDWKETFSRRARIRSATRAASAMPRNQQQDGDAVPEAGDHVRGAEDLGDLARHSLLHGLVGLVLRLVGARETDGEEVLVARRARGFAGQELVEGFLAEDATCRIHEVGHGLPPLSCWSLPPAPGCRLGGVVKTIHEIEGLVESSVGRKGARTRPTESVMSSSMLLRRMRRPVLQSSSTSTARRSSAGGSTRSGWPSVTRRISRPTSQAGRDPEGTADCLQLPGHLGRGGRPR